MITKEYIAEQNMIERYLRGELTESELNAFTTTMVLNAEVREEVERMRLLFKHLSLVGQQSKQKSSFEKNKLNWYKYMVIGIFILIGLGVIWWLFESSIINVSSSSNSTKQTTVPIENTTDEKTNTPIEDPIIETKEPIIVQPTKEENTPLVPTPAPKKSIFKEIIEPIQPKPAEKVKKPTQPIASIDPADFEPNPFLENFVEGGFRTDDLQVELRLENNYPLKEKKAHITFDGTLTMKELPKDETMLFRFFTNKPIDFQDNRSLMDYKPVFESEKNIHLFKFNAMMELKPGLYYLILELKESQTMLYVDDFTVK